MTGSGERAEALAAHLWTYKPDNFLPHGTAKDGAAAQAADLSHRRSGEPERGQAADPVRRRDPRRLRRLPAGVRDVRRQ
jgi:DNA polymerase IIIc chi subunit